MAIKTITYDNKVALNENPNVAEINKVTDNNMNVIKNAVNTNTPVGSISLFAGKTAPTGWLICDGSAVSRTTYANLFSVIGTTSGSGNGSTTFNNPVNKSIPMLTTSTSIKLYQNSWKVALRVFSLAVMDSIHFSWTSI